MRYSVALSFGLTAFLLRVAAGEAAPCDRLTANKKKQAQQLFASTHLYDCCDETLDRCLQQKKICKLAKRLRDDICRRLRKGQNESQVRQAMERRARSMTPLGKKATFDLTRTPPAGKKGAPVQLVVYACVRCPFCAKVVPQIYRLVNEGALKVLAELYFRPFPIRSHEGSTEGGLAFFAAAKLGKFWPYATKVYTQFDQFSPSKLLEWAPTVGLDQAAFQKEMQSAASRYLLTESKKEGLRNKIEATPTLFINGRIYYGELDTETLSDIVSEEADRVRHQPYCAK
jgi:protein-disulfide isomerase